MSFLPRAAFFLCLLSLPAQAFAGTANAYDFGTEEAVKVLRDARILHAIDSGFDSGALTYHETRTLYEEQSRIRAEFIRTRASNPEQAAQRLFFMMQSAQTNLSRLMFNSTIRVTITTRVGETPAPKTSL